MKQSSIRAAIKQILVISARSGLPIVPPVEAAVEADARYCGRSNPSQSAAAAALLGNFLHYCRLWRSDRARAKLSARSTFKPNLTQFGVVLAHARVAGFAGPLKTFLRQIPIVGGRCHI